MSHGDSYLRCSSCSAVAPIVGTSPLAPCPDCGEDTLIVIVEIGRDPLDAALSVLAEYVTLPYAGRRLVADAGSPARVRADARNRAMMARVIASAVSAVIEIPDEEHVCTCDHTESCDGCAMEWFPSRCRFEAALRTLAGLDAKVGGGYDAGSDEDASEREVEMATLPEPEDPQSEGEGELREEDVCEGDALDDRVVEEELPGDAAG